MGYFAGIQASLKCLMPDAERQKCEGAKAQGRRPKAVSEAAEAQAAATQAS